MKCVVCSQKKADRFCAGLQVNICSLCCGSKRERYILCFQGCEYLKKGKKYQFGRQISKDINSTFKTPSEDILNDDEAIQFIHPLESFFLNHFYQDKSINDNHIYKALVKIYSYQTKNANSLKADNKCEEMIFGAFNELMKITSDISDDLKTKSILRLLKSIKTVSGGVLGNRNYLDLVYSQFNKDGKWRYMFEEEKTNVANQD